MHGDEWKAGHREMDPDAWKGGADPGEGEAASRVPAPGPLEARATGGRRRPRGYWIWPVGLVCAFLLVMGVNAVFVYVAVSGADEVVESYATEAR